MSQSILEVIEGPMDGLNTVLSKSGMIGRSVGNVLSLALDLEVSGRHCEIVLEGPAWCLRDQGSSNGTWFKSERLASGRSYSIPFGQIFLVGSTVVQLYKGSADNPFIAVMDPGLKDPRAEYSLSADLLKVWEKLMSVADEGEYCDTTGLFLAMIEGVPGGESRKFESVVQLKASSKFRILDSWLLNASFEPFYQMVPKALTIAPRVWRLLDIAAVSNPKGEIAISDVLKAMLEEGKSLASRHMARDFALLEAAGLIPAGSVSGRPVSVQSARPAPEPLLDKEDTTLGKKNHPLAGGTLESASLNNFAARIELLVHGFLDDAANPVAGQTVQFPGLQRSLQDILNIADPGAQDQAVQEHMDLLYSVLVAVLASQREGAAIFGKKLCQRIDRTIASSQGQAGGVLSLGKKKIDPADVANSIRGALAKAESSGLSERIVRKVLIDKMNKFGMGR